MKQTPNKVIALGRMIVRTSNQINVLNTDKSFYVTVARSINESWEVLDLYINMSSKCQS